VVLIALTAGQLGDNFRMWDVLPTRVVIMAEQTIIALLLFAIVVVIMLWVWYYSRREREPIADDAG